MAGINEGMAKILEEGDGFSRTKRQLKSFVKPRLVAVRTDRGETALGHFRSVWPEFVIGKSVRLRVNFAVGEHPIAILAVQSPLSLRHSMTLWRGAGLAVTNNAKTHQIENVQN